MVPSLERSPLRPLIRFEREMENLMERLGGWEGFEPKVNVAETEKEFEITAELPGLKPEEVTVEIRNGDLWISGERKEEKEEKGKTWHRVERRYGEFRRTIPLPEAVAKEKVEATFSEGVLKVIVPKTEEAKPRHIEVKAA